MQEELKYGAYTEKIIGAAMKVHRYFGTGFLEIIYKRALCLELDQMPFKYKCEQYQDVIYNGILIGRRRLDLVIEDKILIEVKAVNALEKNHFNQTLNYLKLFRLEVGLLLNFGTSSLQFKRLVVTKDISEIRSKSPNL